MENNNGYIPYTQAWDAAVLDPDGRIADMMVQIDQELNTLFEDAVRQNLPINRHLKTWEKRQEFLIRELKRIRKNYVCSSRRWLLRFAEAKGIIKLEPQTVNYANRLSEELCNEVRDALVGYALICLKSKDREENEESQYFNEENIKNLFERLLIDTNCINAEDILQAGYALGLTSMQVENFGARVGGESIIPITTAAGLIHHYCLDCGKTYSAALELLEGYEKDCGDIEKSEVDKKPEAFTRDLQETPWMTAGNSEDFKRFLAENAPYLDMPSRTAQGVYRRLAVYYSQLCEGSCEMPDVETVYDAVRDRLFGSDSNNWEPKRCEKIQRIMRDVGDWCCIQTGDATHNAGLKKEEYGHRIFSCLTGNYAILTNEPPEKRRLLKSDILLLLYEILCMCTQRGDIKDAVASANLFYALGNQIIERCGMEFYLPSYLEYSFLLSLAGGNMSMDELLERDLFSSDETRKKFADWEANHPDLLLNQKAEVKDLEPESPDPEGNLVKVMNDSISNILKALQRDKPEYFSGVPIESEIIEDLLEYFLGATEKAEVLFNETGIYESHTEKSQTVPVRELYRWQVSEQNPMTKAYLKRTFDQNEEKSVYSEAQKIVAAAKAKSGFVCDDTAEAAIAERTAVRLYLREIIRRIQLKCPATDLKFKVLSDKKIMIRLVDRR